MRLIGISIAVLTVAFFGFLHSVARAQSLCFKAAVNYAVGSSPQSVCAADLDGDGDQDLALANRNDDDVSVLKNNGDGTFAPAVSYAADNAPYSVFAADLDGDGDQDLAVANQNSDNVSVLTNNGTGTFAAAVNYAADNAPYSVFAADLDGDGDQDLAVANRNSDNVSVLKNNGNGTFAPAVSYAADNAPYSVFAADLDGDGDRDLAVANNGRDNISVLKNNGNGTFSSAVNYAADNAPYSVFAADLDGDGDRDLAVANNGSENISVLKNNGNGTFAGANNYTVGKQPAGVFAVDLDGDGDRDLAAANNRSNNISVLKNDGNGTFAGAINYTVGKEPTGVFAANLDGDLDLDLATANGGSDNVSILLNCLNRPPTLDPIGAKIVAEGATLAFQVHATDPDGTIPSLTTNGLPTNATFTDFGNGSGSFTFNPDYSQSGVYTVRVTASDGTLSDFEDVTITVTNTNRAPVLDSIREKFVAEGSTLRIRAHAKDPDGTIPILTVSGKPSTATFQDSLNGSGLFVFNPNCTQVGVYNVTLTASDSALVDTEVVAISVTIRNQCFTAAVNYPAGSSPQSVFVADLDGDGDQDLAVANGDSHSVSVLKNNGDGTFAVTVNYATGDGPQSIFVADLDGDGDQDLAVANYWSGSISVLKNNGNGTFAAAVNFAVGYFPQSVFAADLDGDGDQDLAVAKSFGRLSVLKNNGDGTYSAAVNYAVYSYYSSVIAVDLDGDGDQDLAVADAVSNTVSVLKNNGSGSYVAAVNYVTGRYPRSVISADLDGDGDNDLVTANYLDSNVSVLKNNGNGTFASAVNFAAGIGPKSVAFADIDGDGDRDLIIANEGNGTVSVLNNNGDGTYAAAVSYVAGSSASSVVAADLNGDGNQDLAVANAASNDVSIILSVTSDCANRPPSTDPIGPLSVAAGAKLAVRVHATDPNGTAPRLTATGVPPNANFVDSLNGSGAFIFNPDSTQLGVHNMVLFVNDDAFTYSEWVSITVTEAGPGFDAAINLVAGIDPVSIFAADLDGDRDRDLAVANYDIYGTGSVSVLKNDGDGSFASAVNYDAGTHPSSVFASDLNGDGHRDLAVTNATSSNVSVLMNKGDGTFAAAVNYAVGSCPVEVYAADLDGDNDVDLVVANADSANVSVLKNNGNGTFAGATNYATGGNPQSVIATDLDGDGDRDLVVANRSGSVSILKNNGNGTFAAASNYATGGSARSVIAADLDGDGDRDLAVANGNGSVAVLKNNGNGTFAAAVNYVSGSSPTSVVAADLDGDGDQDLAVADGGGQAGLVTVLMNSGDGSFPSSLSFPAGSGLASVVAADLDGDGDQDLAVAGYIAEESESRTGPQAAANYGGVSVLINRAMQPLSLSRDRILFYHRKGSVDPPPPETLLVGGAAGTPWSLQKGGPWLGVNKTSGTVPDIIVFTADAGALEAGIYSASAAISVTGSPGPPQLVDAFLHVDPAVQVGSNETIAGTADSIPVFLSQGHDSIAGLFIPLSYAQSTPLATKTMSLGFSVDSLRISPYYKGRGVYYTINTGNQTIIIQRVPIGKDPIPSPDTMDVQLVAMIYYSSQPLAAGQIITIDTMSVPCPPTDSGFVTPSGSSCSIFYQLPNGQIRKPSFKPGYIIINGTDPASSGHGMLQTDQNVLAFECTVPADSQPVGILHAGDDTLSFEITLPSGRFEVSPTRGHTPLDVWVKPLGCWDNQFDIMTVRSPEATAPLQIVLKSPPVGTGVSEEADHSSIPKVFGLSQNYPNPFNSATVIEYDVPRYAAVDLAVYNVLGQRVVTLAQGEKVPGRYRVTWDTSTGQGSGLASGVYLLRLETKGFSQTRKIVLLK